MPLDKSGSAASVGKNIKAEVKAGKPKKQALAIALNVERENAKGERKAKLDAVPGLIALGLTREQIAQVLNLSLAEISEIIQQQNINTKDK